jgi:hypothetical protein
MLLNVYVALEQGIINTDQKHLIYTLKITSYKVKELFRLHAQIHEWEIK